MCQLTLAPRPSDRESVRGRVVWHAHIIIIDNCTEQPVDAKAADDYGYPRAGQQKFDWLGYQRAMQQRLPTAHGSKYFWHPEDPCSQQYFATASDVGIALHQLEVDPTGTGEQLVRRDVLASIERYLRSPNYAATSTWRVAPIDDAHVLALLTAAADKHVAASAP